MSEVCRQVAASTFTQLGSRQRAYTHTPLHQKPPRPCTCLARPLSLRSTTGCEKQPRFLLRAHPSASSSTCRTTSTPTCRARPSSSKNKDNSNGVWGPVVSSRNPNTPRGATTPSTKATESSTPAHRRRSSARVLRAATRTALAFQIDKLHKAGVAPATLHTSGLRRERVSGCRPSHLSPAAAAAIAAAAGPPLRQTVTVTVTKAMLMLTSTPTSTTTKQTLRCLSTLTRTLLARGRRSGRHASARNRSVTSMSSTTDSAFATGYVAPALLHWLARRVRSTHRFHSVTDTCARSQLYGCGRVVVNRQGGKRCNVEGCNCRAQNRGLCWKHGECTTARSVQCHLDRTPLPAAVCAASQRWRQRSCQFRRLWAEG